MAASQTLVTADQLLRLSAQGKRYELVKGELREMAPTGGRHGRVAIRLGGRLNSYVDEHNLGEVFAAETGFRLSKDPDTVRAPDVAFVARGRLPEEGLPAGYPEIAPDLVVEVLSPSDAAVEDWLEAGVKLVWVVYPDTAPLMMCMSCGKGTP